MYDLRALPDRPTMKCARVTGEVMGKYHPHGDSAIYGALVRMGQSFSLRHPLVHPKGNFGSLDEPPAAARYTECRLAPMALDMLADIDENTVDFIDNYSGEFQEPVVLPSRFPNLLVNGSQGIAVGMATNIPPHNLGEVIDAVNHLLQNPEATPDDLMEFVKGPDFPTEKRSSWVVKESSARTELVEVQSNFAVKPKSRKEHDPISSLLLSFRTR